MDSSGHEPLPWPAPDAAEEYLDNEHWPDAPALSQVPDGDMLPTEYAIVTPENSIVDFENLPPDLHPDFLAIRRDFLDEINAAGDRFTEEVPSRLVTGYIPQTRFRHGVSALSPVLTERRLYHGRELTIEAGENAFVRLRPGEVGAVATARLTGCTAAAGIAYYADGSRVAYISHHAPGEEYDLRGIGPGATSQIVSARLISQFGEKAASYTGLERLSLAVFPRYGIDSTDGTGAPFGSQIMEDVYTAVSRLQDDHGAAVIIEPYKIAYTGGHSVTVHLGETCSTIYFNDIPIAEA